MCDLAVAANTARFAVSGVNLGLFCSTPSVPLSRNLGRKAAFEMLVTGDFIDVETALEQGLVNRVAEPEALDAEVERLVASIVAKPRLAVALGKGLFYRQLEKGIEAAYTDASQRWPATLWTSRRWKACRPSSTSGRRPGAAEARGSRYAGEGAPGCFSGCESAKGGICSQ